MSLKKNDFRRPTYLLNLTGFKNPLGLECLQRNIFSPKQLHHSSKSPPKTPHHAKSRAKSHDNL